MATRRRIVAMMSFGIAATTLLVNTSLGQSWYQQGMRQGLPAWRNGGQRQMQRSLGGTYGAGIPVLPPAGGAGQQAPYQQNGAVLRQYRQQPIRNQYLQQMQRQAVQRQQQMQLRQAYDQQQDYQRWLQQQRMAQQRQQRNRQQQQQLLRRRQVVTSTPAPPPPRANVPPVVISVSENTTETVRYVVNGASYRISAGETQTLPGEQKWTIEFTPGDGADLARYTLTSGKRYEFKKKQGRWNLYRIRSNGPTG